MDELRKPLFFVAIVLMGLAFLLDIGSAVIPAGAAAGAGDLKPALANLLTEHQVSDEELDQLVKKSAEKGKPPGLGILAQALIDGMLLYTVLLMALELLVPGRVQGRVQGLLTLVVSLLVLLASIALLFYAITQLLIMVALLTAAPFGTIAYMVIYGFFPRPSASVILSLGMTAKLAFAVCLVLAQQRFLQNKGLVLLVLLSLLAGIVVSFLHGLVPIFLVSITDAVAAIILAIVGLIWSLITLIFAVIAVLKAVR